MITTNFFLNIAIVAKNEMYFNLCFVKLYSSSLACFESAKAKKVAAYNVINNAIVQRRVVV